MNTIEREEIFDLADDAVCAGEMEYWDKYKNNNGTKGFKTKHQCIIEHVRQAILTQVAKARKDALEEAAKRGKDWYISMMDADRHDGDCTNECHTCQLCMAENLEDVIRNKLEKEDR